MRNRRTTLEMRHSKPPQNSTNGVSYQNKLKAYWNKAKAQAVKQPIHALSHIMAYPIYEQEDPEDQKKKKKAKQTGRLCKQS